MKQYRLNENGKQYLRDKLEEYLIVNPVQDTDKQTILLSAGRGVFVDGELTTDGLLHHDEIEAI